MPHNPHPENPAPPEIHPEGKYTVTVPLEEGKGLGFIFARKPGGKLFVYSVASGSPGAILHACDGVTLVDGAALSRCVETARASGRRCVRLIVSHPEMTTAAALQRLLQARLRETEAALGVARTQLAALAEAEAEVTEHRAALTCWQGALEAAGPKEPQGRLLPELLAALDCGEDFADDCSESSSSSSWSSRESSEQSQHWPRDTGAVWVRVPRSSASPLRPDPRRSRSPCGSSRTVHSGTALRLKPGRTINLVVRV
eukprot:TRINITY_DN10080_c0_g1_i1.p2 TRINITY_DN10080_c0_g1~~TRINITY_DN10080_c0_g1_i1.p2  ORF type:complete len:283 (+),score=71.97 TRINITY_DN10080_c0_g1_i1:80-850(+)